MDLKKPLKNPFHLLILDKMEEKARKVLVSKKAEEEMNELGEILGTAILPKDKFNEIIERILKIASILSSHQKSDERWAHAYLLDLTTRLKSDYSDEKEAT